MNFLTNSHLVLTTTDVSRITEFWRRLLQLDPHFENKGFAEFVLPSGFRFAFFLPTGTAAKHFSSDSARNHSSVGLTVRDIAAAYERTLELQNDFGNSDAGPPKEHPWGEQSFLLIDPDGNRWEITESPTENGTLVHRE
jgi:catechol 2,3-dioxygenase-like lactoylglutathione lyase family enzyme